MISMLTAYAIATNPSIVTTAGGPAKNGKFVGWITLGEEDRFRPLINTEPIYDSASEAKQAMIELVAKLKEFVAEDMANPDNPLREFIRSPEGELVQEIVLAAKGSVPES